MPGLFGIYIKESNNNEIEKRLAGISDSLKHYPSYHVSERSFNHAGIGAIEINDRLCRNIFVDSVNNIAVCMSGCIYAYVDLQNKIVPEQYDQDEEVILNIYKIFGENTPNKLNGEFNVVIYDINKSQLFIFNDRFGFKHLYYYYNDDNVFLFGPEIKSILSNKDIDRSIDEHGIADFFNFSYHMGNRTMFKSISMLPPASCMILENNEIRLKTYWKPKYTCQLGMKDLDEAVETGYHLFQQSLQRRVRGCTNVMVPITGGLDSRLILSTVNELSCKITTATFGVKGCADHEIAKKVCKALGLNEPMLVSRKPKWLFTYADELSSLNECNYAGLGLTTQYGFRDTIGLDFDCFLNGIFGGHLSFGSPYFTKKDLESDYSPKERVDRLSKGLNGHLYQMYLKDCGTDTLNDIVTAYHDKSLNEEYERTESISDTYAFRQDGLFLYNRIRRGMNSIDQYKSFYNNQLPFASYELYDFYLSLSPELLLNHFLYKEIYKRKLPHLASIPWQSTGVNLYKFPTKYQVYKKDLNNKLFWYSMKLSRGRMNIVDKNKDGDEDYFFRKDKNLRQWIENVLLSNHCIGRGYFNKEGIHRILKNQKYKTTVFSEISKMVMFELWAQKYMDRK